MEQVRLELGFDGGQVMGAVVAEASASELEQAIEAGRDDGFALNAEDGHYTIRLSKLVYVKRLSRESRLGFGAV